jgi:spermidine/putrescine transport system ATP-binding protein
VGVRPEKLYIHQEGSSEMNGDNAIEATVRISTYTGVSTSYECTTADGSKVVVYVQNLAAVDAPIAGGSKVRLTWHPEHTFAVEPASSPANSNNRTLPIKEEDA